MLAQFEIPKDKEKWARFVAQNTDTYTFFGVDTWKVYANEKVMDIEGAVIEPSAESIRSALKLIGKTDDQIDALFDLAVTSEL